MLIGLSGKTGCGKTEIAKLLLSHSLLSDHTRFAFGDLIKRETAREFGFDEALCYSQQGKHTKVRIPPEWRKQIREWWIGQGRFPFLRKLWCFARRPFMTATVRFLLQWYGTDYCRERFGEDHWIHRMSEQDLSAVIIDDVRLIPEAHFVREQGGILVRIAPYPGYDPGEYGNHLTETALDGYQGFDIVLHPDYGSGALQNAANNILSLIDKGGYREQSAEADLGDGKTFEGMPGNLRSGCTIG